MHNYTFVGGFNHFEECRLVTGDVSDIIINKWNFEDHVWLFNHLYACGWPITITYQDICVYIVKNKDGTVNNVCANIGSSSVQRDYYQQFDSWYRDSVEEYK